MLRKFCLKFDFWIFLNFKKKFSDTTSVKGLISSSAIYTVSSTRKKFLVPKLWIEHLIKKCNNFMTAWGYFRIEPEICEEKSYCTDKICITHYFRLHTLLQLLNYFTTYNQHKTVRYIYRFTLFLKETYLEKVIDLDTFQSIYRSFRH